MQVIQADTVSSTCRGGCLSGPRLAHITCTECAS